jgi:hypothetical protein
VWSLQQTAEFSSQHFHEMQIPRRCLAQQQVSPSAQKVKRSHLVGPGEGGGGGFWLVLVGYEASMLIPQSPFEFSLLRSM